MFTLYGFLTGRIYECIDYQIALPMLDFCLCALFIAMPIADMSNWPSKDLKGYMKYLRSKMF